MVLSLLSTKKYRTDDYQLTLENLLIASATVAGIMMILVALPSFLKFKRDRVSILNLFLAVPKEIVDQVLDRYKSLRGSFHFVRKSKASMSTVSGSRKSNRFTLTLAMFFFACGFIVLMIFLMYHFTLQEFKVYHKLPEQATLSDFRISLALLIQTYLSEYLVADPTTWGPPPMGRFIMTQFFNFMVPEYETLHFTVKHGGTALSGPFEPVYINGLDDIMYSQTCTDPIPECDTVDQKITSVGRAAKIILSTPAANLTWGDPNYQKIIHLLQKATTIPNPPDQDVQGVLIHETKQFSAMSLQKSDSDLHDIIKILDTIFGCTLVGYILASLALLVFSRALKADIVSTYSLISAIPRPAIEKDEKLQLEAQKLGLETNFFFDQTQFEQRIAGNNKSGIAGDGVSDEQGNGQNGTKRKDQSRHAQLNIRRFTTVESPNFKSSEDDDDDEEDLMSFNKAPTFQASSAVDTLDSEVRNDHEGD